MAGVHINKSRLTSFPSPLIRNRRAASAPAAESVWENRKKKLDRALSDAERKPCWLRDPAGRPLAPTFPLRSLHGIPAQISPVSPEYVRCMKESRRAWDRRQRENTPIRPAGVGTNTGYSIGRYVVYSNRKRRGRYVCLGWVDGSSRACLLCIGSAGHSLFRPVLVCQSVSHERRFSNHTSMYPRDSPLVWSYYIPVPLPVVLERCRKGGNCASTGGWLGTMQGMSAQQARD